jgi:hypothetical protein
VSAEAVITMRKMYRIVGAAAVAALVVVLGTLHAVGYREALARVEDYVTAFRSDVPGAIEPYGLNRLLKTTRVRYNDSVYQVSMSQTSASSEAVIEAYARSLPGTKLVESTEDGQERTLYHSDGATLTAVRAMPMGGGQSGTLVQKMHTVKNPRRSGGLEAMPELTGLAAGVLAAVQDRSPEGAARRTAVSEVLQRLWNERRHMAPGTRRRQDRPGFDIEGVSRFPGAVRLGSMALEDGTIQIVRYAANAEPDSVVGYYGQALPAEGWVADTIAAAVAEESGTAENRHMIFTRGEATLQVMVTPLDSMGRSAVTVMLQ